MHCKKMILGSMLALAVCLLAGCASQNVKHEVKYDGMLGPEHFWRPRDNMTFYLYDKQGGGFNVDVAVRDINTYMEGARPVYLFIVDPEGKIVDSKLVKDDGVTKNDYHYKDGLNDIWMDVRYREYHRAFSPNGLPPGKKRSPKLSDPASVKPVTVTLNVPSNCGKGVYRLGVCGSWDHFLTVTSSKRLLEGVHPGQCGLYLHGNQFENGRYLYLPEKTGLLYFAVTEEVRPFSAVLETPFGKVLPGKGFLSFLTVPKAPQNKVIKISAKVKNPGTMLHIKGVPMILCETEEAAKAFANFEDPAVTRLKKIKGKDEKEQKFIDRLCMFSASFGFSPNRGGEAPIDPEKWKVDLGFRSNWWDFGDGWFSYSKTVSPEVKADAVRLMEQWVSFRYAMEIGLCPNQWGKILEQMTNMYEYTSSPLIREAIEFNAKRMCTPYSLGRANPDRDTFLSGYEPDNGMTACGIMSEAFGHDAEYNLETDSHLSKVYSVVPVPEILAYLNRYYNFKTHLTIPRGDFIPRFSFSQTVSPTDTNFRTRYFTHKACQLLSKIHYGDIWGSKENKEKTVWPAMETAPSILFLDKRYAFVNTGKYYAVIYVGANFPVWQNYSLTEVEGNTLKMIGFFGAGYGGWQPAVGKPGGISAIWVPGCGPVLLSCNHNAMYSNILWGKVSEKLPPSMNNVDREMTMESMAPCKREFSEKDRILTASGSLPRTGLTFRREVKLHDSKIQVKLNLKASKDIDMKDLFETIPLYAEQRTLKADDKEIIFPKPVVTPSHKYLKNMEGYSDVPPFKAKQLSLTSKNGKGMTVSFSAPVEMVLTQVLKYRDIAAPVSGVSIKLPKSFKKGQTFVFEYTIDVK